MAKWTQNNVNDSAATQVSIVEQKVALTLSNERTKAKEVLTRKLTTWVPTV
jgi:hypothetical protein